MQGPVGVELGPRQRRGSPCRFWEATSARDEIPSASSTARPAGLWRNLWLSVLIRGAPGAALGHGLEEMVPGLIELLAHDVITGVAAPFDQFHRQEVHAAGVFDRVDRDDVWRMDRRRTLKASWTS